jgi:peptide deformylase
VRGDYTRGVTDHAHHHDDEPDHDHDDEVPTEEEYRAAVERAARKQAALAQIRQYGDPALRMRAAEVEAVDDEIRELTERMLQVMHDADGIGLAATQVGILRRFFVCAIAGEDRVVVNPVLSVTGKKLETDEEGCLSLGSVRVPVERPVEVTLAGLGADGEEFSLELEGIDARVVQHELDHLDGTLIVDRTDPDSRREALSRLRPRLALR